MQTPDQEPSPDPILAILEAQDAWASLFWGTVALIAGLLLLRGWWHWARPLFPAPLPKGDDQPVSAAVLLVCILVLFLVGPLLSVEPGEDPEEDLRLALRGSLMVLGLTSILAMVAQRGVGEPLARLGFRRRRPLAALPLAAGTYVSLWPLLFAATALQVGWHGLRGTEIPIQNAVEILHGSSRLRSDWWFLAGVTLLQPCLEEVLYRGVLLGYLRRAFPALLAILVDSVLFALVHDAGRPQVFVLSVGMGLLYVRTGSLLAPCLLHIMHNSVSVLLFLTQGGSS